MKLSHPPSLRSATVADVPAVVALINAAFAVERFFVDGDRIDADEVTELLGRGVFLVAERADQADPLGVIYVEPRGERCYFGLLAIAPAAQRGGLGRALVAAAERLAQERRATAMDMRLVNLRDELPAFYRGLGYVEVGTEPFENPEVRLTQPCHFILMSKALAPVA